MWVNTTTDPFANNSSNTTYDTVQTQVPSYSNMEICPDIQTVGNAYKEIHGYTSLLVCTFGTLANILNVIVLTRKEMITPTNVILTALAIADLLNMVEYVPFAVYMNFLPKSKNGGTPKTYGWALFVLFHSNFSQICHTTAIWLTLTLAIWRYIMVSRPVHCKTLCSMYRAKLAVILAYIISPILCIPIFYSFSVSSFPQNTLEFGADTSMSSLEANASEMLNISLDNSLSNSPSVQYIVNLSTLAQSFPFLKQFNFWFFSIVIKLIPCAILTIVSIRLVNSMYDTKRRKEALFGPPPSQILVSSPSSPDAEENISRSSSFTRSTGEMNPTTRTTRMLLAVLVLFLITEFPQGILALLSDLWGEQFFNFCYMSLSDLMDFMALLNSAINFILYCAMSRKFRETFTRIFKLKLI